MESPAVVVEKQNGATYITELNEKAEEQLSDEEADDIIDTEREEKSNIIFNVREAVPPQDYDAPYSQLPESVGLKKVKQKVKKKEL
jgi:hypothetical protein